MASSIREGNTMKTHHWKDVRKNSKVTAQAVIKGKTLDLVG